MRRTATILALVLATLSPLAAYADDTEVFLHAVGTYTAGRYADAAREFYDLYEEGGPSTRPQAEYYLAECFYQMKLLQSALYYYGEIINRGASHPKYADALVGLVKVDEQLGDDLIIPSLLNNKYDEAANVMAGKDFPQDVLLKINYIVGRVTYEKGKFDDAVAFLDTVTPDSTYYARAQYLKGVVLARQGKNEAAEIAFEKVLALKVDKVHYLELDDIHDLALLGAARVFYGMGKYDQAAKDYEAVPRFSRYWDQALFEDGWARFQNEDLGGALGSLQALHAPQFEGSFQPESWVLKATVYFYSCLYDEAKFALKEYEDLYLPMSQQIKPLLEGDHDLDFFAHLVDPGEADKLPRAVRNYLLANARLRGFLNFAHQLDTEKAAIEAVQGWRSSKMSSELEQAIDQQQQLLLRLTGKFVKDRLAGVSSDINGFEGQVAIIRFETTKAEKEILETGTDVGKHLRGQKLYRPDMPGEDWDYWAFQGEFWIDEIGYYQYTLKSGCVKRASE